MNVLKPGVQIQYPKNGQQGTFQTEIDWLHNLESLTVRSFSFTLTCVVTRRKFFEGQKLRSCLGRRFLLASDTQPFLVYL